MNTKNLPTTARNSYETCLMLASYKEYESLYRRVPDDLVGQASRKFQYFELDAKAVEADHYRITILDPVYVDSESISCILQMSYVLNMRTGKTCKMKPRKDLHKDECYCNSRSLRIILDSDLLSEEDFGVIREYENWWNKNKAWSSENINRRCYIKPAADNFLFQFLFEIRKNPQTEEYTFGITNINMRGAGVLSTFPTPVRQSLGKPRKQRGGKAVELPLPQRQV